MQNNENLKSLRTAHTGRDDREALKGRQWSRREALRRGLALGTGAVVVGAAGMVYSLYEMREESRRTPVPVCSFMSEFRNGPPTNPTIAKPRISPESDGTQTCAPNQLQAEGEIRDAFRKLAQGITNPDVVKWMLEYYVSALSLIYGIKTLRVASRDKSGIQTGNRRQVNVKADPVG
jgi:hypothetical protein